MVKREIHTMPCFNRSISCFSIAVSNLAAIRAFSSLRFSRLSIFLWIGTICFCLLNLIFLIRIRYCVIFINLCLHFAFIKPGQYSKFSLICCIAFSKFLESFTFSHASFGKCILQRVQYAYNHRTYNFTLHCKRHEALPFCCSHI